jgi:uncharacterized protein YoxC
VEGLVNGHSSASVKRAVQSGLKEGGELRGDLVQVMGEEVGGMVRSKVTAVSKEVKALEDRLSNISINGDPVMEGLEKRLKKLSADAGEEGVVGVALLGAEERLEKVKTSTSTSSGEITELGKTLTNLQTTANTIDKQVTGTKTTTDALAATAASIRPTLEEAVKVYNEADMGGKVVGVSKITEVSDLWKSERFDERVQEAESIQSAIIAYNQFGLQRKVVLAHTLLDVFNHPNLSAFSGMSQGSIASTSAILRHPNLSALTDKSTQELITHALHLPTTLPTTITTTLNAEREKIHQHLEKLVRNYLAGDSKTIGDGFNLLQRLMSTLLQTQWDRVDDKSQQFLMTKRFDDLVVKLKEGADGREGIDTKVARFVEVAWKGEDDIGGERKKLADSISEIFESSKSGTDGLDAKVNTYAKDRLRLDLYGNEEKGGMRGTVMEYLEKELDLQWKGEGGRKRAADAIGGLVRTERDSVWEVEKKAVGEKLKTEIDELLKKGTTYDELSQTLLDFASMQTGRILADNDLTADMVKVTSQWLSNTTKKLWDEGHRNTVIAEMTELSTHLFERMVHLLQRRKLGWREGLRKEAEGWLRFEERRKKIVWRPKRIRRIWDCPSDGTDGR